MKCGLELALEHDHGLMPSVRALPIVGTD